MNTTFWYPCKWYCKKLERIVSVGDDAIPISGLGFMCDCMRSKRPSRKKDGTLQFVPCKEHIWVKEQDYQHNIIQTKKYDMIFIEGVGFLKSRNPE